jgi:hypothetical protein
MIRTMFDRWQTLLILGETRFDLIHAAHGSAFFETMRHTQATTDDRATGNVHQEECVGRIVRDMFKLDICEIPVL